jgi:hypothetical protein
LREGESKWKKVFLKRAKKSTDKFFSFFFHTFGGVSPPVPFADCLPFSSPDEMRKGGEAGRYSGLPLGATTSVSPGATTAIASFASVATIT